MNKKAEEGPSTLKTIIIAVMIGLVLLVIVSWKVMPLLFSTADTSFCKTSATAVAATKIAGVQSPFFNEMECKTQFIDVKKDKIYNNDKEISVKGADLEEKIKRAMANEMYDCWYQMGEGQIDPFSSTESKSNCIICSEIKFDDEARKRIDEINGFYAFLKDQTVTGKEITYWEYLTGSSKGIDRLIDPSQTTDKQPITTKEDYSVVFISDREVVTGGVGVIFAGCGLGVKPGLVVGGAIGSVAPGPGTAIGGVVGALVGCAGGALIGNTIVGTQNEPHTLAVGLLPSKEVAGKCEQVYSS